MQSEGRTLQQPGSNAAVRLPADISDDGKFQSGFVEYSGDSLKVYGEDDKVIRSVSIGEVESFEARGMVGNGVLEAKIDGVAYPLARFSVAQLPRYSALARYLNERIEGEDHGPLTLPEERKCPTCGRPLPEGTNVCPRCVNKIQVIARLFRVARPYGSLLFAAMALLWTITGLRLVLPQLNRMLVDDVLRPGGTVGSLMLFVALIGIAQLLTQGFGLIRGRVMAKLSSGLSKDLRAMVYEKLQALSLKDMAQRKTGDLMNRVTGDTERVSRFIDHHLFSGANELLTFIGIAIILFAYSWQLALLVLLPTPLVIYIVRKVWRRIRTMYRRQWRSWDKVNSMLQDVLSGVRVVKAFGQEEREAKRFVTFTQHFAKITEQNEKTFNTLFPLVGYLLTLGNFVVLYYGGQLVLGERMGFGELLQFSQYAAMLYGPLRYVSFFPRWFTEAMTAAERIFEVIDLDPNVRDSEKAVHHKITGRVVLENVTFGYKAYEPVLEKINLEVEPGEAIGLVGHSGAGKSTLINLVARFYDVDRGRILIDGIDIRDMAQQTLRSQLGVVLQETFLFSGTIAQNIAYAKPDATPEQIIRAAKIANAHDFITRFNDGYDTLVGERGQRLSGGERQRIAIARAILHDPKILILDEATASMDTETEYQIQEALGRLMKDRTTFAIAHRLSTLRNVNRLVVLDKGRIAEIGSHDELLAKKGIYYRLVMAQRQMTQIEPASTNGAIANQASTGA